MYDINEDTIAILSKVKISTDNPSSNQIRIKQSNLQENREELLESMNLMKKQKDGALNVGKQKPVMTRNNGIVNPKDQTTWGRVGRNDLCPCDSGKKYKQCCGKDK